MPNIEIHGLHKVSAARLSKKVFDTFSKKKFSDEIVVTLYDTNVWDKNGRSQPFFRILSSEETNEKEIIRGLKKFNIMDIELLPLKKFIPKLK